jgi:lipopolysaccharide transport system ATP-binding protein
MTDAALLVEGLGKRYDLGGGLFRRGEEFWALRDVSFSVQRGEAVGIIGANGAGKSTLLKILARITAPSTGRARVSGRVGTILEVGTGFHPELTGRENIYLNGAILGLSRAEITARFDEIVDFAEVARFIDTPVKRYSSGMYVRLAFAVAAHLEPDILIVDEVLAVGDIAFQRKCLARMDEGVEREGRTILFVSHNYQAIRHLCTRAILIEKGALVADGLTADVLSRYTSTQKVAFDVRSAAVANRLNRAAGRARFSEFELLDRTNEAGWTFAPQEPLRIRFGYEVHEAVNSLSANICINTLHNDQMVTSMHSVLRSGKTAAGEKGQFILSIPALWLRPGDFALSAALLSSDSSVVEDLLDSNVGMPLITMSSEEDNPLRRLGVMSIPHNFIGAE